MFAGKACFAQKPGERLWRRIGARAFKFLVHRFSLKREAARDQGEAAGRDEGLDAVGFQSGFGQLFRE